MQSRDQALDALELLVVKPGPQFGAMQRGRIASPVACKLGTEAREVAQKSAATCLRTRAAQQRHFERFGRALERAGAPAQPAQRMLQQRQQDRRPKLVCCRPFGEPGEKTPKWFHQRVAAGT